MLYLWILKKVKHLILTEYYSILQTKQNLKRSDKYVPLSKLSIYYIWKIIKKPYKNNKFKISAAMWNDKSKLPGGSHFVSDIQDYFEYIFKTWKKSVNPSIRIYLNKTENRITFKIKTEYYIELLTPETMKLLGSTKSRINIEKNGENVPNLEITEVLLVNSNIVNNNYQQVLRALYTFIPDKSFGQLLVISPQNFIF